MATDTITSANAILALSVAGLFPAPERIQGFSTDKAWDTDSLQLAEVQMGVDGRLTAGYTPTPTKMKIRLQADSPSKKFFKALKAATVSAQEVYYLSGTLNLKSTGEAGTFTRGVLTAVKQIPDGSKVLDPTEYEITWERLDVSAL